MILLSCIPSFFLKLFLQKQPIKKWIYLGKDNTVSLKFRSVLPKDAIELEYAKKLYTVSQQMRGDFIGWIDDTSFAGKIQKEWIFSVPAVKNTFISDLFLNICYFFVLEGLRKEDPDIDLIIVDSSALALSVKEAFSYDFFILNNFFIVFEKGRVFLKSILRFVRHVFSFLRRFWAVKIVLSSRARQLLHGKNRIVLIRNYITDHFLTTYQDTLDKRYFPKLYSYLEKEGATAVFLPIPVQIKNYKTLLSKVKESKENIVFFEEFLKLKDYLYTFLTPLRALRYRIRPPLLHNFNLSRLIKEEYYANLTQFSFLYAILLSCFGKRVKERDLRLSGLVNWCEFQSFERGLMFGIKQVFPQAQIIGSQPFLISPNHLSIIPSRQEKLFNLVPDKMLVLGPLGKDAAREFIKDFPVEYTPLFRYQSVFKSLSTIGVGKDLLVVLGYALSNTVYTLRILLAMEDQLKSFPKVRLKLHPVASFNQERLKKELGIDDFPSNFEFVTGPYEDYLASTSIAICGATGTSVELVVKSIPVVLISETNVLTMNYLAYKVDPDLWQLCFNAKEASGAIKHFLKLRKENPQHIQDKAFELRKLYFAQPNDQYWQNYLTKDSISK